MTSPSTAPATREYLRANLFDGDEDGTFGSTISHHLDELTEVVDDLTALREQEAARRALEALLEGVKAETNPWDREPVGDQPFLGPAAVGFEEARSRLVAAIDAAIDGAALVRESGATPEMVACDECNANGCPPHYGAEDCKPGCVHPSCRAKEIAAGIEEIGTGGTPAFIRGYNAGYDDAYEHQEESGAALVSGERSETEAVRLLRAVMAEIDGLSTRYYRASFSEARRFLEGTAAPVGPALPPVGLLRERRTTITPELRVEPAKVDQLTREALGVAQTGLGL